ncbi:hypothetical protein DE4381_02078 [Mycobacterium marinum]|nr:hypothetical protein DE4381_02078 [Mycobacterium marinum]
MERICSTRQTDLSSRPGLVAAAQRGNHGERGVEPTTNVPRGQHMVDRAGMVGRTGDERESGRRVDGVVHPGTAVSPSQQLQMDDVRTRGGQYFVAEPGQAGIGHHDSVAFQDEALDQPLSCCRAQIDGGRTLALVQPGPVDRCAAGRQGPAADIGGTADRVDADNLRTQLAQRHAAQRRRDEAGYLYNANAAQRQVRPRHGYPTRSKIAARPWPPPIHIVSSP